MGGEPRVGGVQRGLVVLEVREEAPYDAIAIWIERVRQISLDRLEVRRRVRRGQLPLAWLCEARDRRLDQGVGELVGLDDRPPTPVP